MCIHIEAKYPLRRQRLSRATLIKNARVAREHGRRVLVGQSGLSKGQSIRVVIQIALRRSNDQSSTTG